jgi:hypothetical protein
MNLVSCRGSAVASATVQLVHNSVISASRAPVAQKPGWCDRFLPAQIPARGEELNTSTMYGAIRHEPRRPFDTSLTRPLNHSWFRTSGAAVRAPAAGGGGGGGGKQDGGQAANYVILITITKGQPLS